MTPEAQRIAIAEKCGIQDPRWTADGLIRNKLRGWVGPDDNTGRSVDVPDYLNDLNAMHEAEKTLTPEQDEVYHRILADECSHVRAFRFAIHSTAAQRAEAFLRTLNLWTES